MTPATHPTLPIARAPFGRGEHLARAAVGFLRVPSIRWPGLAPPPRPP
ncbi:MAG: hypothetical protein R3F43_05985 [bacterium]